MSQQQEPKVCRGQDHPYLASAPIAQTRQHVGCRWGVPAAEPLPGEDKQWPPSGLQHK